MKRWVAQPSGTYLCGQVCVAVLCEVELDAGIRLVGHKNSTTTSELVRVLRGQGFELPDRAKPGPRPELGLAVVRARREEGWSSSWHWVVVDGEKIWDGALGLPDGTVLWPETYAITSYVPVYESL